MAISVVDVTASSVTIPAGLTTTITLSSTLGDGETGIIVIRNAGASAVTGVVDNSSGTPAWTKANTNTWLGDRAVVYYRPNVSGSPTTVTVTSTVQTSSCRMHTLRVSGIDNGDPVYESGEFNYGVTGEGGATSHSVDVSNGEAGRLIVGVATAETGPRTWTEGTGVTMWHAAAEPYSPAAMYRIAPDAGPTAMAWTFDTSSTSNVGFVVFNAAPDSSTARRSRIMLRGVG